MVRALTGGEGRGGEGRGGEGGCFSSLDNLLQLIILRNISRPNSKPVFPEKHINFFGGSSSPPPYAYEECRQHSVKIDLPTF